MLQKYVKKNNLKKKCKKNAKNLFFSKKLYIFAAKFLLFI